MENVSMYNLTIRSFGLVNELFTMGSGKAEQTKEIPNENKITMYVYAFVFF